MRKGPARLSLELEKDLVKSDRKSQAFRAQDRGLEDSAAWGLAAPVGEGGIGFFSWPEESARTRAACSLAPMPQILHFAMPPSCGAFESEDPESHACPHGTRANAHTQKATNLELNATLERNRSLLQVIPPARINSDTMGVL